MLWPMPVNDFKIISSPQEICKIDFKNQTFDQNIGYFLCVDMQYPESLHNSHNSYPMLPNVQEICWNDLSPYSKKCLVALEGKNKAYRHNSIKLGANFLPKKEYLMHYMNFKQALQMGIKCTKIHYITSFRQFPIIKDYIDILALKRAQAKTEFERKMLKTLSVSLYGKWIHMPVA